MTKKQNFITQMANIGMEIERTIVWSRKNNEEYAELSFFRALSMLDGSIKDSNKFSTLKELTRLRELLADYFYFDNSYHSKEKNWSSYFYPFNYLLRKNT